MTKTTYKPDAISYLAGFGLVVIICLVGYAGWQIFKTAVNTVVEQRYRTAISDCIIDIGRHGSGTTIHNGQYINISNCDPF